MKNGDFSPSDIIIHAAELENRCDFAPAISVFLTPAEQSELAHRVRSPHRLFFWGGFSGAERCAAVFLPEWASDSAPYSDADHCNSPEREAYLKDLIFGEDAPFCDIARGIVLLRICGSGHRMLRHKDILGSLMGLGITRQSVGDICMISDFDGVAAVTGKLSSFICEEFVKAGSDGVSVSPHPSPGDFSFERQFEEISCTVASMRLDGIVSAVTGMSRSKADEYIASGLVLLCGTVTDKGASEVMPGDTVTVRGYGKFFVESTDGMTRKSRIRLNIKKYI